MKKQFTNPTPIGTMPIYDSVDDIKISKGKKTTTRQIGKLLSKLYGEPKKKKIETVIKIAKRMKSKFDDLPIELKLAFVAQKLDEVIDYINNSDDK